MPTPELPCVPGVVFAANAPALRYLAPFFRSSLEAPVVISAPVLLGRSKPKPVLFDGPPPPHPFTTVIGRPLRTERMPLTFQPPSRACWTPLQSLPTLRPLPMG